MEKEELPFINQLINTLNESESKLEEFYKDKDSENFNNVKRFILKIQKQLDGELQ